MWKSTEAPSTSPHRCCRALALLIGLGLLAFPSRITPCGTDFPSSILERRTDLLLQPPKGSFEWRVKDLLPEPRDAFVVVETDDGPWDSRERVDRQELTPEEFALVEAMRSQFSAAAAYDAGAGLPESVRLYTAGAVAFHDHEAEVARSFFKAVLEGEDDRRAPRHVWAAFMLGRAAEDLPEAQQYFALTRDLVRQGARDSLGLAAESFGAEAKFCESFGTRLQAVELVLEHAALGSEKALARLSRLTKQLFYARWTWSEALANPTTRALLLEYVLTYASSIEELKHFRLWYAPEDGYPGVEDFVQAAPQFLEEVTAAALKDADSRTGERLVHLAYLTGDYERATRLAASFDTPIVTWVQAKLALRRGDDEAAAEAYARILDAFPDQEVSSGTLTQHLQVTMEAGTLHLMRDEYLRALALLYRAVERDRWTYWGDVAYLAERVLTVDELKGFVDREVPKKAAARQGPDVEYWLKGRIYEQPPATEMLRSLLGRRLLREGRGDEAITYFDDPFLRSVAEEYIAKLKAGQRWWRSRVARAESLFEAATIARYDGMEILGYELEPDFACWEGKFWRHEERDRESSAAEKARVAASAPEHDLRYHYTLVAVDHASRATDLLPPRTQAFAAILCQANSWTRARDPETAAALYRRYQREGAFLRWAKTFGYRCPRPDFEQAALRVWQGRMTWLIEGRGRWLLLVTICVAAAFGLGRFSRRRRTTRTD